MLQSYQGFVSLARATMVLDIGAVPSIASIKDGEFFRKDLPSGAEFMNEQLSKKPPNLKREDAAAMVSQLVADALKGLQRRAGPFGLPVPSARTHTRYSA